MISRLILAALGIALFASATMWSHSGPQLLNAWICGLLLAQIALVVSVEPWNRVAMICVALWLLLSDFVLPRWNDATLRMHAMIGLTVLLLAAAPSGGRKNQRRPAGQRTA